MGGGKKFGDFNSNVSSMLHVSGSTKNGPTQLPMDVGGTTGYPLHGCTSVILMITSSF